MMKWIVALLAPGMFILTAGFFLKRAIQAEDNDPLLSIESFPSTVPTRPTPHSRTSKTPARSQNPRPSPITEVPHQAQNTLTPAQKIAYTHELINEGKVSGIRQLDHLLATAHTTEDKMLYTEALVGIGTEEAIQKFAEYLLIERDPETRQAMAESLNRLSSSAGLEMVTSMLLLTRDPVLLAPIQDTLSRMASPETITYLTEFYHNPDTAPTYLDNIITTMSRIENGYATAALGKVVRDSPSAALASAAAESLSRIGTQQSLTQIATIAQNIIDHPNHNTHSISAQTLAAHLGSVLSPSAEKALVNIAANQAYTGLIRNAASKSLNDIRASRQIPIDKLDDAAIDIQVRNKNSNQGHYPLQTP